MKRLILAVLLAASAALAQAATNTVSVNGTYDFTVNNGCSSTVTTGCLKQFNVYDVTGAIPVKLGSVAAPSGANTASATVSGTFTIPALVAGIHSLAITAQMADGTESDPKAYPAVQQVIRPGVPVNLTLTAQ